MIKKILLTLLALLLLSAILPGLSKDNSNEEFEPENTSNQKSDTALTHEDSQEIKEEGIENKQEEVYYSKDKNANEIINRYNRQNPDSQVEPYMVENWLTGGYDQATDITIDDYEIHFGYADGTPTYSFFSYADLSEENKEEFLNKTLAWIRAIHEFSDETMDRISNYFLNNSNPELFTIQVEYNKYKYISYKEQPTNYGYDCSYWIFCYEDY